MRTLIVTLCALVLVLTTGLPAQDQTARRLYAVIVANGVPIANVSIGDGANKATWKVRPESLQPAAQPYINAFDPNDPALEQADMDAAVKAAVDTDRLTSAVVWTILKQMYPADTDAQTKTKYGVARTRIIDSYKSEPWK